MEIRTLCRPYGLIICLNRVNFIVHHEHKTTTMPMMKPTIHIVGKMKIPYPHITVPTGPLVLQCNILHRLARSLISQSILIDLV